MDHLDNAFNGTVEFLNEHTLKNPLWIENYIKNEKANKNSTTFETALHSALYDPINPQHISFALNLPAVQFADWEEDDDEEQEEQPQQSKPKKIKKTNSKKSLESLSPESTKPVNHYFQAIKDPKLEEINEKMYTRRMYERQRWLCVLRDAAKAGQFLAVQKEVMEDAERLPSNFQFWDYV
jgi:translation elongation factor EF-G